MDDTEREMQAIEEKVRGQQLRARFKTGPREEPTEPVLAKHMTERMTDEEIRSLIRHEFSLSWEHFKYDYWTRGEDMEFDDCTYELHSMEELLGKAEVNKLRDEVLEELCARMQADEYWRVRWRVFVEWYKAGLPFHASDVTAAQAAQWEEIQRKRYELFPDLDEIREEGLRLPGASRYCASEEARRNGNAAALLN
jgi:hypothetical protein